MARLWGFRIALLLAAAVLAAPARAETIEFVTYYPAPTAAGTASTQAMAIGTGYQGTTPDDGELLVFDRLGIGPGFDTAQPIARLHVVGSANATNYAIFMPGQGGNMRVGIGTTAPGNALEVSSNIDFSIGLKRTGAVQREWHLSNITQDPGGAPPRFRIWDHTAGQERFCVTSAGSVGIGTTNPATAKLVVSGFVADTVAWPGNKLVAEFTSGQVNSSIRAVNSSGWTAYFGADSNGDAYLGSPSRPTHLWAGGSPRLSISSNGYVGIGTTAPQQRLHVYEPNGGVWAAQIQGNQYGLYGNGYYHGVYGYANGGWSGWGVYGANSGGGWGGLGLGQYGLYCGSPNSWSSVASGSYYGAYGYGGYYGGYFQNGTYWYPGLFAYNGGSGYWAYIAYGYYGLYTNGYIYGYWASSKEYKKNITPLSSQQEASILSRIEQLPMIHYLYKTDPDKRSLRLGVTAESMPKEVTSEDGKGLEPSAYTAFSLAGVKALAAKVTRQEKTIQAQQEELLQIRQQIQQLQKERK